MLFKTLISIVMIGIRTGIGIGMGRHGAHVNLSPEYKTILSKVATKPSTSIQKAQNAFVLREISEGRWPKYACLLPYAGGMPNPNDAIVWWNNPNRKGTLSATAPTYDIGIGFTGNGSSAYVDTTFNFSVDGGGEFTQNDNAHGYWYANQRFATGLGRDGGQPASNGNAIVPFTSNSVYMSDNSDYKSAANALGTQYLFTASRIASTGFKIYQNEIDLGTLTQSSLALGNFNAYGLWGGQTGQNYSVDTLGLQFYASSFTAADVLGLKNSWLQLLSDIEKCTVVSDDCAGTVINSDKWTITNPDPLAVSFSQNNGIIIDSVPSGSNANALANIIKNKDRRLYGSWKLSMVDISQGTSFKREVGIADISNKNRIFVRRELDTALLTYSILRNNVSSYSVLTNIDDFAILRFEISTNNDIKLFSFVNDAWVQIGITQNFKMGAMSLYAASGGGTGSRTIISDVLINGSNLI